jgi:hypothetical protein
MKPTSIYSTHGQKSRWAKGALAAGAPPITTGALSNGYIKQSKN